MAKVTIERIKDRIHVEFDYDAKLVSKMRGIAGRSFVKRPTPHWTAPLNMATCRDLRTVFGSELEIGPALWEWAKAEAEAEKSGAALAEVSEAAFNAATLEHVPSVAPALYKRMQGRPYQIPAAAFCASRSGALLADQPGLGKTTEIMGAIIERNPSSPTDVLVIAPSTSLETVWGPEMREWMPEELTEVFVAVGTRKQRDAIIADFHARRVSADRPRYLVLCVNAEMIRTKVVKEREDKPPVYVHEYPALFRSPWTVQVVDEGHKYLITRYSQLHNPKLSLVRRGMAMLPLAEDGLRIAGSGTPFKGRTANFWGTLNWLYPAQQTSFWNWAGSFLEVTDNGFGKDVGDLRPERREELYRSLSTVMIRRTKSELRTINPLWAPPDKEYQTIRCVMGPAQRKLYEQMATNAAVTIGSRNLTADGVLAEITRLKQFAHAAGTIDENGGLRPALPSAKFDQIVQMLKERGISGDKDETGEGVKVVIAGQFTQMLDLYSGELAKMGIDHFLLTGATKQADRAAYVARFQQPGGPRVFMLNTAAGGVSITLDAADELWMLDETWVPDDQEQVEDRVHRTSRVDHQVTISYFVTLGTVEEEIAQVTAEKDYTQKLHLDERRGVTFAKKWAAEKAA